MEEWRIIPGFEKYEASNLGRIRSVNKEPRSKADRVITARECNGGYLFVSLNRKSVMVHKLVALAFIGARPHPSFQINHKDGDKTHNAVANLEYCTASQNYIHAIQTGLAKTKITASAADQIRAQRASGASIATIAKTFRISTGMAYRIVRGEAWKAVS